MLGSAGAAADVVAAKIRAFAAHRLEASADDVVLESGRAWVRGFPDRAVGVAEIARLAYSPPPGGLPDGLTPGLGGSGYFDPPRPTFSGAIHVALVQIDPDTGRV